MVKIGLDLLKYNFPALLVGDFKEGFLEEYQGRVEADFRNVDALNVLRNGKGSNPYSVVLANKILREIGLRTATPADIERILVERNLDLSGACVNMGLVLRDGDDPNKYLAKDLIRQLRSQKLPVMIPLAGLDLRVDDNSPSGLTFKVRTDAEVIYDEILNNPLGDFGTFYSGDINEKTGLPKKLFGYCGDRKFWTRDSGLSEIMINFNSNIYANHANLDYSPDHFRMVVVDTTWYILNLLKDLKTSSTITHYGRGVSDF